MPGFDPRFDGLTPDDAFAPLSNFDDDAFENTVLPDFDTYLDDMALRGYDDVRDVFISETPITLEDYRCTLSTTLFTEHPEWVVMQDESCEQNPWTRDAFITLSEINTREAYDAFENTLLQIKKNNASDPRLTDALFKATRKRGGQLYGVDVLVAKLEEKYHIVLECDNPGSAPENPNDNLTFEISPMKYLKTELEDLAAACEFYPPFFIAEAGIDRIVLCTRLRQKIPDRALAGLHSETTIFIGQPGIFHHELFHALDASDAIDQDPVWREKQLGTFYENTLTRSRYGATQPGFATGYAFEESARRGDMWEDRAEIAYRLFDNYEGFMEEAAQNESLACKIDWVKSYYYAHSNGRMDALFWDEIAVKKRIDAAYWTTRESRQAITGSEYMPDEQGEEWMAFETLTANADADFWAGNWKSAATAYAELVRAFPDEVVYWERLGQSQKAIGLDACATVSYESAVKAGSRNEAVFRELIDLYGKESWLSEESAQTRNAANRFQALVDANCDNPELYRTLAKILFFDLRDKSAAIRLYKSRIDLCRADGRVTFELIPYFLKFIGEVRYVLPASGTDSLEAAITFAASHLRYEEPLGAFYAALDAFTDLGRQDAALPALRSAVHSHPEEPYLRVRYVAFLKAAKLDDEFNIQRARAKKDFPYIVDFW